jgi:hypothetical protein
VDVPAVNTEGAAKERGHRRRSFSKAADIAVPGDGDLSPLPAGAWPSRAARPVAAKGAPEAVADLCHLSDGERA